MPRRISRPCTVTEETNVDQARNVLEQAAEVAEHNRPYSLASGDHAQAELQQQVADECRQALDQLPQADH